MIADESKEINTDDAAKLIGCINGLSKRIIGDNGLLKNEDPNFMRRAVAFCQSIKISKKITETFNGDIKEYYKDLNDKEKLEVVNIESKHIDGSMNATVRSELLSWLKSEEENDNNLCKILTNVKCLSEGVDVPSLDAVLFLSAKNSQVDVVQSVGRVMRKAQGKKYGYIIIPIFIPANEDGFNPIYIMADSGARGSKQQIRQLAGMRGLMAKPSGDIIELPIISNFKEGLTVQEYFISTHGARKGLADTALKTSSAGYLTRKLVDVAIGVVVSEPDCGTVKGIVVEAIKSGDEVIDPLKNRVVGFFSNEHIYHPITKELICSANTEITEEIGDIIEKAGIEKINII